MLKMREIRKLDYNNTLDYYTFLPYAFRIAIDPLRAHTLLHCTPHHSLCYASGYIISFSSIPRHKLSFKQSLCQYARVQQSGQQRSQNPDHLLKSVPHPSSQSKHG